MPRMSIRVVNHQGKYWAVIVQGEKVKNASGKLFKKVGPGKEGRVKAEKLARAFERMYGGEKARGPLDPIPIQQVFEDYKETYGKTSLKHSTQETYWGCIDNHIVPYFGEADLRTIKLPDLLKFAAHLSATEKGTAVVKNSLSVFRRVVGLAIKDGELGIRNPASRIGEHVRGMENRYAGEVRRVDAWTAEEAGRILELAERYEPRIYVGVLFGLHTGARRGEILGLQWPDIDAARSRAYIRRGRVRSRTVTPKSGRERIVALSPPLLSALDRKRKEARAASPWDEESWIFPTNRRRRPRMARNSKGTTPMQEKTFREAWARLQARFQPEGIRPLVFHCTRHTFATLALEAGKSVKWVAEMLGHADPSITLRIYAHAIPSQESDLSFLPGAKIGARGITSVNQA